MVPASGEFPEDADRIDSARAAVSFEEPGRVDFLCDMFLE